MAVLLTFIGVAIGIVGLFLKINKNHREVMALKLDVTVYEQHVRENEKDINRIGAISYSMAEENKKTKEMLIRIDSNVRLMYDEFKKRKNL